MKVKQSLEADGGHGHNDDGRVRHIMPREHEDYRNNIEQLNRLFPMKEMLTVTEAQRVMGYGSVNTIKKYVPFTNGRVSKATLARIMCGGEGAKTGGKTQKRGRAAARVHS